MLSFLGGLLSIFARFPIPVAAFVLGIGVGWHGQKFFYDPVEDLFEADDLFTSITDVIITDFEGGWVVASDGSYAGIDRKAHPDSPLWGWDLSTPTEQIRREVYGIYRRDYYARMHISEMPASQGFLIYDFGVHAGVHTSIRTAQRCVFGDAREIDGYIGPHTLSALHESGDGFDKCFTFARLEHYGNVIVSHPEKAIDWHGWVNRARKSLDHSETLR